MRWCFAQSGSWCRQSLLPGSIRVHDPQAAVVFRRPHVNNLVSVRAPRGIVTAVERELTQGKVHQGCWEDLREPRIIRRLKTQYKRVTVFVVRAESGEGIGEEGKDNGFLTVSKAHRAKFVVVAIFPGVCKHDKQHFC